MNIALINAGGPVITNLPCRLLTKVGTKPDVPLAHNTPVIRAFKRRAEDNPIVFTPTFDPSGWGFSQNRAPQLAK